MAKPPPEPVTASPNSGSLEQLLGGLEFTEVRTYYLHAERGEYQPVDDAQVEIDAKQKGATLEVKARLTLTAEDHTIRAVRSAVFTLDDEAALSGSLIREFTEKVGIMALYPYLREAVFTLAANLGVDTPVMGLLRAGTFELTSKTDPKHE